MSDVNYDVVVEWTGNDGRGVVDTNFNRSNEMSTEGRPTIPGGTDDWSPEHLLVAAVSQCTMLWFLHLCGKANVNVHGYTDAATATLTLEGSRGQVTEVVLHATVAAPGADPEKVRSLFEKAGELCYIARTLNCPVKHELHLS